MNANFSIDSSTRKYLIPEEVYDFDHPDVVYWTQYYLERSNRKSIFDEIDFTLNNLRSIETAKKVSIAWYEFTRYVPGFISKAVVLTTDPERQHHLIQIAYDELGGRDKDYIHSKLFLDAVSEIGIDIPENHISSSMTRVLSELDSVMDNNISQYGIVGLLLSFEIIAEENVEMLFNGLCYNDKCNDILSKSKFFQIHREDESEHIRHSIANFLRFCGSDEQKFLFEKSFDEGILFWNDFWSRMKSVVISDI
ncbi:iron-containing redox enzyme family protein [Marinomonas sp. 2405UD68-3]|uniref:iron-containing redox enzyme family protein n=1 Tax=Marinomonas sp. 2405UD68-3 TaxID=3391835 RepID=UPI0039C8ED4F